MPSAHGRPFPPLDRALPVPPDERLGIAVVGLGDFALAQILPNIPQTRRCRLAAVVSGNVSKGTAVARAYGLPDERVYTYDTFDRLAEADDVGAVYVILPNALHREWTERAFAAGKHVLCEKPMAVTVAEGEAMIAAGEKAGRVLMVAYRAHFEPHNLKAIDMIRKGAVGTPRLVAGSHGRLLKPDEEPRDEWRAKKELAGGGSLYDIGIYEVNGACYLLGEEPVEVTARWTVPDDARPAGVDVECGIAWTLRFPGGATAVMDSSYVYEGDKRLRVDGTKGWLELNPATDYHGNLLRLSTEGETREVSIRPTNQFAAMLDHFAACALDGETPKTPGSMGLRDLRILEALYRAADGGGPVTL